VEPAVTHALEVLAKRVSLDGQMGAIDLALREAIINAVKHGNRQSRRKRVLVECYRRGNAGLVLVVRDQGKGFDPDSVPDPLLAENLLRETGRGLLLIRHFMDEVSFHRGGREIRMVKKTGAPSDTSKPSD
jgi:serine/threonine-protein kinase RsbW